MSKGGGQAELAVAEKIQWLPFVTPAISRMHVKEGLSQKEYQYRGL